MGGLTRGSAQITHSEGSSDVFVLQRGQVYPDADSSWRFPLYPRLGNMSWYEENRPYRDRCGIHRRYHPNCAHKRVLHVRRNGGTANRSMREQRQSIIHQQNRGLRLVVSILDPSQSRKTDAGSTLLCTLLLLSVHKFARFYRNALLGPVKWRRSRTRVLYSFVSSICCQSYLGFCWKAHAHEVREQRPLPRLCWRWCALSHQRVSVVSLVCCHGVVAACLLRQSSENKLPPTSEHAKARGAREGG